MATHGLVVRGTSGTAAASVNLIGAAVTLPAGGPWVIHDIWMQIAQSTAVADESTDGTMQINAASGDITPDPAPGRYPISYQTSPMSANYGPAVTGLNLWRVNWQASGKAVIEINHVLANALAVAPAVAAGIIFGDAIPEMRPLIFCDRVQADFAATTEQSIGTITLAEKATRIVGLCATLAHSAAAAVDIPAIGSFRIDSDDVKITPGQFPLNCAIGPGDGTIAGATAMPQFQFIPVDIPVEGGARIDAFATTIENVTNSASITVYVAYE